MRIRATGEAAAATVAALAGASSSPVPMVSKGIGAKSQRPTVRQSALLCSSFQPVFRGEN